MAKDNLFLGQARGKVGDVVFYVRNGRQCSRPRVRTIANPSTNKQLIQRAIVATVSQAYRLGSAIFDHSFEGQKVKAGSQAMFQKRNMRKLRDQIVAELNALQANPSAIPDEDQQGIVTARGSVFPVPWKYRVSEGTLVQSLFVADEDSQNNQKCEVAIQSPLTNETLSAYCTRLGIVSGDIYTIVGFGIIDPLWASGEFADAAQATFGFVRLKVKDTALSSSTAMATATLADMFTLNYEGATPIPESTLLTGAINVDQVVFSAVAGTIGVIRSRESSGQRSTCDMYMPSVPGWGIKTSYLLDAWDPTAVSAGEPELILDGGGF